MGRRRDRTGDAPEVAPLDVDGVRTLAIITVLWAVAFVVLAFQRAALNAADNGWWLWTCLAGVGLGLLGLEYCRKRRDAIAHEELQQEADAELHDDGWADGEQAESVAVEEPVRASEVPPAPQPETYPAAEPLPERPVHAEQAEQFGYGTGEEVPPVHRHDDQYQYRESRPPPGYVTGDLPVVPQQQPPLGEPAPPEPAPAPAPQQWHDQPWPPPETPEPEVPQGTSQPGQPGFPYQPAAPAGYSPEPDFARRHPRDTEMARRWEEDVDPTGGTTGLAAPMEFLQDEPEPAAGAPEAASSDVTPDLLAPEPDAVPPHSQDMPGSGPAPEPPPPPAQPAPRFHDEPDLVSEFFSDLPQGGAAPDPAEQADDEDPDLLLGDKPRAPGRRARRDPGPDTSSGYRGRRARRD